HHPGGDPPARTPAPRQRGGPLIAQQLPLHNLRRRLQPDTTTSLGVRFGIGGTCQGGGHRAVLPSGSPRAAPALTAGMAAGGDVVAGGGVVVASSVISAAASVEGTRRGHAVTPRAHAG